MALGVKCSTGTKHAKGNGRGMMGSHGLELKGNATQYKGKELRV